MTAAPRCKSQYGPDGCQDPDCPQRVAGFHQFMSDFIQPTQVAAKQPKTRHAAAIAKVGTMTETIDSYDLDIDESVIDTFSYADCWALALELHAATGWDLVGFGEEIYEDDHIVKRGWVHAAVRTPAGMILDIKGLQHEGDVFDGLPEEAEESFTTDVDLFTGVERQYPDVDAAAWAKRLLSKIAA